MESNGALVLMRKPILHETAAENRIQFLKRIVTAGTRLLNRQLEVTFDDIAAEHCRFF